MFFKFVATLAAAAVFAFPMSAAAQLKSGDVAPNVVGRTLQGAQVSISELKGKVVVLSFWATWCPPCLKELPILEGIQKVAGEKHNLQVIAVNTENIDTFRRVSKALQALTLVMAHDPGKKGQNAYGVTGIPHLVIIGRDGVIVRVYRGYGEETLGRITDDINLAIGATSEPPLDTRPVP